MSELSHDPWETPPIELDPSLVETSQRLMAKSHPPDPVPVEDLEEPDPHTLRLQELRQQTDYLLQRNANLVAENARLQAANQRLLDQVAQLRIVDCEPWIVRVWQRLTQGKSTHSQEATH